MPSLVPDPDTGEPVWDYDLAKRKPAKKAASNQGAAKPAKKDEE